MVTMFEVWNGASVVWDGVSWPRFVFPYPRALPAEIAFLQLSGRICELQTQAEWALDIGGALYDIPNLPHGEIHSLVFGIRAQLGYMAQTVPYQLGNPYAGGITIPLVVWVDLRTGRADTFSPVTGLMLGQQHLAPQAMTTTVMQPLGLQAIGAPVASGPGAAAAPAKPKSVLDQIGTIATGLGKVADFLKSAMS